MFRSSRQYISQYSHCIIRTTEPYVERVKAVNHMLAPDMLAPECILQPQPFRLTIIWPAEWILK